MNLKSFLYILFILFFVILILAIYFIYKGTFLFFPKENIYDLRTNEKISSVGYINKCWRKELADCLPSDIYQNIPYTISNPYYEYQDLNTAKKFAGDNTLDLSLEASISIVSNAYSSKKIRIIDTIRSIENIKYKKKDDDLFIKDKLNSTLYEKDTLNKALNDLITNNLVYSKTGIYYFKKDLSTLNKIVSTNIPVITSLNNSYIVVYQIDNTTVKYLDPTSRKKESIDINSFKIEFNKDKNDLIIIQLTDKGDYIEANFKNINTYYTLQANCITYNESKFDPKAVGPPNSNGTQDFGLMQINNKYWPDYTFKDGFYVNWDNILDPEYNIKVGYHIFYYNRKLSFSAWSTEHYCSPE